MFKTLVETIDQFYHSYYLIQIIQKLSKNKVVEINYGSSTKVEKQLRRQLPFFLLPGGVLTTECQERAFGTVLDNEIKNIL